MKTDHKISISEEERVVSSIPMVQHECSTKRSTGEPGVLSARVRPAGRVSRKRRMINCGG